MTQKVSVPADRVPQPMTYRGNGSQGATVWALWCLCPQTSLKPKGPGDRSRDDGHPGAQELALSPGGQGRCLKPQQDVGDNEKLPRQCPGGQ